MNIPSETKRCTSCGTPIKFIKLESGKFNPVDLGCHYDIESIDKNLVDPEKIIVVSITGKVGKLSLLKSGYLSHFSTCPNSKSYKRNS